MSEAIKQKLEINWNLIRETLHHIEEDEDGVAHLYGMKEGMSVPLGFFEREDYLDFLNNLHKLKEVV